MWLGCRLSWGSRCSEDEARVAALMRMQGGSVRWLGWWQCRERLGLWMAKVLELVVAGSRNDEEQKLFVSERQQCKSQERLLPITSSFEAVLMIRWAADEIPAGAPANQGCHAQPLQETQNTAKLIENITDIWYMERYMDSITVIKLVQLENTAKHMKDSHGAEMKQVLMN